ncbi:MAG TPA: glycosyltransferase [Acidimicrobiia bacterium]|jgi:GT2 family glycosyltransferase
MRVSAVMAARDEPLGRVQRAIDALAGQHGSEPLDIEVVIAAPPAQHQALALLRPHGAVEAVRLVRNPCGERSPGLNRAVRDATAPFVVRVDARSVVPPDYVSKCVERLAGDATVGVVGGVQRPAARSHAVRARGIARALRNPWLLGGARYRRAGSEGPADTVYLGAFRRADLLATRYDECMAANEDFDLCARFRREGRAVWIERGLEVAYEVRDSYRDLWHQYAAFGASKVGYWRRTRERPNQRQLTALAGATGAAVALATQVRHPRRIAAMLAAGAAALAVVDHLADRSEPDPRVRAHAMAASATVMTAWVSGVARAALASATNVRR